MDCEELGNLKHVKIKRHMAFFPPFYSISSVTAQIIIPVQHVSVLDFHHIESKISRCAPVVLITMKQNDIQIQKRGIFLRKELFMRRRERPVKFQAMFAHSNFRSCIST